MAKYIHTVKEAKTGAKHTFKSINKAKAFIEKWGIENDQHTGKIDIDKNTIMWEVGTFANPVLQYSRTYNFNQ